MGSVDGNGVLEMGVSGTATWLIIPYSEAAPTHNVNYGIGGTLYYTVGGQNITVPLFPETITVTPDPRLYLNYFLERNVRSDDPLTEGTVVCSTRQLMTAAFVFRPTHFWGAIQFLMNHVKSNIFDQSVFNGHSVVFLIMPK